MLTQRDTVKHVQVVHTAGLLLPAWPFSAPQQTLAGLVTLQRAPTSHVTCSQAQAAGQNHTQTDQIPMLHGADARRSPAITGGGGAPCAPDCTEPCLHPFQAHHAHRPCTDSTVPRDVALHPTECIDVDLPQPPRPLLLRTDVTCFGTHSRPERSAARARRRRPRHPGVTATAPASLSRRCARPCSARAR
jgi:hypothetical protein